MIPEELIDKYELVSILQKSAATAVLLVKHRQIGDTRVLKAIQKSQSGATRILSEANLLAGLKSPGIPTIYDVGQNEKCNYLVEEYIEGQSLLEYLLENQKISLKALNNYILDVCSIIEKLHLEADEPILYRDMKPEHIYIKSDRARLIDFGAAVRKSEFEMNDNLCSKKYAAPEQLAGAKIDERTDIYGIGKVLEFAVPYIENNEAYKIKYIVSKATEANPEKRFAKISELKEALLEVQGTLSYENLYKIKRINKRIVIAGCDTGVGCTHIAINICSYLNSVGIESYYTTENKKFIVRRLYENFKRVSIKGGVLYHKDFKGLLENGPGLEGHTPPEGNMIIDAGNSREKDLSADYIIYVISQRPWIGMNNYPKWIKDKNVILLANFSNQIKGLKFAKTVSKKVYIYPKGTKPFDISKTEARCLKKMFKENGFETI